MSTRTALDKLPEKCRETLETHGELITKARLSGLHNDHIERRKKVRGYLECLEDLGILSATDMRCLYIYYTSRNPKSV